MRKAMVVTMMLALALLANAEPLTVTLQKGDEGRKLYYSHPECQGLSCDEFLAVAALLNGFDNTDENWKKIRAGQEFILPVEKTEPITTAKEITEDATDGGNNGNDGRNGTDTIITDGGGRIDLREAGLEPYSLEALLGTPLGTREKGPEAEQSATTQPSELAASESALIIADLTRQNEELKIREQETEAEIVKIKQERASALQLAGGALKQKDEKIARLERQLADKSKAEAITLGNNGSYLHNSSDSFMWIKIAFAITAIMIIIISFLYARARYQVSQLQKSDRLRRENEPKNIQQQIEREVAQRMKNKANREATLTRKVTRMRRLLAIGPHFALYCPGAIKKATKQSVDDEIFLPIQEWREDGLPLLKISGKENLVPAIPEKIVEALLSEDHQNQDDAYVLPLSYHRKRLGKGDQDRVSSRHKHSPSEEEKAHIAAAQ